jgi:undecaprenyl-diphosphatase
MINYFQAIVLGGIQGVSELFPVSSLGHSVIIPALLAPIAGWNIDQNNNFFLIFLVATHLATSLVLFGFFWKDWVRIISGMLRSIKNRYIDPADTYARLGWLIVVATVPAGILGLLFQDKLQALFASPRIVAVVLILNGGLLYGAEVIKKKQQEKLAGATEKQITTENGQTSEQADKAIANISWTQSVKVGCAQALALIPGFSRSGASLAGGLLVGLEHESAARFAFLLATPIIFAAGVLKLPDLLLPGQTYPFATVIGPLLAGAIAAAIGAYLSVRFLTSYFQKKTMKPFAIYCVVAGIVASVLFLVLK